MMTYDISRLQRVVTKIVTDHKKDAYTEATRTAKDVGYRAMSFTGFITAARIERSLKKGGALIRLAMAALAKRGEKRTRAAVSAEATKILNERKRTSKARRAGWIPGILALGGTIRGAAGGIIKPGGTVSQGYGKKANLASLVAVIANAMFGIQDGPNMSKSKAEMVEGLRKAIRFVTRDRIKYLRKKTEQMLRKNAA